MTSAYREYLTRSSGDALTQSSNHHSVVVVTEPYVAHFSFFQHISFKEGQDFPPPTGAIVTQTQCCG